MSQPRTVPLFDSGSDARTWNEQMQPGEYAVHYSSLKGTAGAAPYCIVLGSLSEAVACAQQAVEARPTIKCRIYDHRGFVGAPLREIKGTDFKEESGMSSRFRRWVGSVLFFGGLVLTLVDWTNDFKFMWPSMIGTRMLIPGLVLLFTEAMVVLHARMDSRSQAEESTS